MLTKFEYDEVDWSVINGKNDPRWNDTGVTESSGNIFADMGFDVAEAEVLALRAQVMVRLEQHLAKLGWSQTETAAKLGINQPRVSRLRSGAWKDFSLDMLLTLAARAGLHAKVRLT